MDFSQSNYSSYSKHMIGATNYVTTIPTGSKIVHIDFLQSGTASNTWVECGGMEVARNFARDAEVYLAFTSTTTCSVKKTGNDQSFVTIVYYDASVSSSTAQILSNIADSAIGISYILILSFFTALFFAMISSFWGKIFYVPREDYD